MSLAGTVNIMATGPVDRGVEVAAAAERLGFTRCWLYDEGVVTRDVYVTLAAIAGHARVSEPTVLRFCRSLGLDDRKL